MSPLHGFRKKMASDVISEAVFCVWRAAETVPTLFYGVLQVNSDGSGLFS